MLYAKTIKEIKVVGNKRIDDKTVINYSGLKIGQQYDKYTLNNSLKKIYRSENFADISIQEYKDCLEIKVLESPIIGDIFFTGSSKFDVNDVKKTLSTKSRQVYSKSRIKLDAEKIQSTFRRMGFLKTNVESKVVFLDNNSVDVIFNINEGNVSYIDNIMFVNNKHYSDSKLKSILTSKKRKLLAISQNDGNFIEDNMSNDVKNIVNFYQNNGFAKAYVVNNSAEFNKKNYNFIITYTIHEGDIYNFGKSKIITNITKFDKDNNIKKLIFSKEGKKFSLKKIKQTVSKITKYFKKNGYNNINVTYELVFNENEKKVDIEYHLDFNKKVYIDKIIISGNNRTQNNVILRELVIHEGDMYDIDKINISRDRLYMLGFFKKVEIKENPIPNSDLMNLEIIVEEQFFGRINFSVGYSSYYGIVGSIALSVNNILGHGISGNIGVDRNGFMESYNIGFFDPYIFGDRHNIGLGVNTSFSRFGNLGGGSSYISYFPYKGYNFSENVSISFELANRLMLTTTVGVSKFVYKMLGSSDYKLYQQLIGTRNSQTIGFSLSYNKMNRIIFATKGYILKYGVNFAGLGITGGQQFVQNTADIIGNIQILGENLYLHTEASGGIINNLRKKNILGMENLFTLGGYSRMRGFDFYGIGPRIEKNGSDGTTSSLYFAIEGSQYYFLSAELRTPLFIPKDYNIYFSAFIDAGSVWGYVGSKKTTSYVKDNVTYTEVIKDSSRIRVSAGIGITWQTMMFGEIGFYYAKPLVKQPFDTALEFGIKMGTSF